MGNRPGARRPEGDDGCSSTSRRRTGPGSSYDRENKRALAAAGGTWSLRNGEYVEECEFATDNIPQIRGNSYPYEYRLEGDQWTIKGGANRGIREDQTFTRVKKPNP